MKILDQLNQCVNPIWLKKERIFVNCGKCEFCRKLWRNDWAKRIEIQKQLSYLTLSITLTYNDENLPLYNGVPSLDKEDIQKFFKRLRKESTKLFPDVSYQYFIAGEYGSSYLRPHYHLILFVNTNNHNYTKYDFQTICLNKWNKGYVYFGEVNYVSIKYLAKYIGKTTGISEHADKHGIPHPFVLMSRRPAIASKYLEKDNNFEYHFKSLTNCHILMPGMGRQLIPRYFRKIVYQHYPKAFKEQYYFDLKTFNNEKHENKIRESARRLRIDNDLVRFNNRFNPDLDKYREEEQRKIKSEQIEMINYYKQRGIL